MTIEKYLAKNIINVFDQDGNKISYRDLEIINYKSKYNNSNKGTLRIFLDDSIIPRENYKIQYRCICGAENIILSQKYLMRKVDTKCRKCVELDDNKKILTANVKKGILPKIDKSSIKIEDNFIKICDSYKSFNAESHDFKIEYFRNRLTTSEFDKIKNNIISINNYTFNNSLTYIPYCYTYRNGKYSNYIYDDKKDILIHFSNIIFRCEMCSKEFNTTRSPKEKVNKERILCKECNFCNNTFKIRKTFNICGDFISYQSKLEYDFILFCNENNIKVENGETINYIFNNKTLKYRIDFKISQFKILIELKDNHIWHIREVESGKWKAKEDSALSYAKENELVYHLVYKNDLESFCNTLINSLDLDESPRSQDKEPGQ